MAKYKILQVVPAIYSGGVGSFLLNYYSRFDKNLFQFDFITHFDERARASTDSLMAGSNVYYFHQQHDIGTVKYIRQFKKVIKQGEYDIVHIHNGHVTGVLSMICKWYGAKKTVCHAHTTRCMNPKLEKIMPVLRWMSRFFSNRLMACGHDAGVFCYGTNNFMVIPNGIDVNRYQRASDNTVLQLKQEYNIGKDTFIAGCVAQFTPPKNHMFLLSVFKAMHDKNPNSVLMLVGEGNLRNEIEGQIEKLGLTDNVILTGSQTDIPKYISLFDVFLLPSIHEGLPVVAAEAQSLGVKCVFSKHIDNTCDRRVGLMKFLPITEDAIGDWVIESFRPAVRPSRDFIMAQFTKDYYEINEGTKLLQNEYLKLIEE